MKKKHTVRTIPKSNIKIVERGKMATANTPIHDRSPFMNIAQIPSIHIQQE